MKYVQRSWGWFILGFGFDPYELFQIKFDFDLCIQHKEFTFGFMLVGVVFDFYIMEPLENR